MDHNRKTALYVRVSTDSQFEEGYSVEAQTEKLEAWCKVKNYKNTELYVDGGWSGSNIDRPELRRLMGDIAMGKVGSDIAVDAADIALVNDDIKELPHLLKLSRRMMNTIRLNLTFSMALNFIAIILAITGILNPVVGALVHNAGSVLVIINSAFLLGWKKRN